MLVLLLGFFFLLDHSFNPHLSKLSHEAVDAGLRVDGKVVLQLEELVSRVEVVLSESDIGNRVDYLYVVVR